MPDKYDQYKKACKAIRTENKKLLDDFSEWLSSKNLSKKTINKHCSNIDFYINEFLLYESPTTASEGVTDISMFLGYWFIKKAMWASPSAIKENATSLKKFYRFMLESGKIDHTSLEHLKMTIKEEMPDWISTIERYDDPSINDSEEIWGY